jgi:hypothetical protein
MKKHDYIIILAIALYIIENFYFGWNEVAQSIPEKVADSIVFILMIYGFLTLILDHIRPHVTINLGGLRIRDKDAIDVEI